MDGSLKFERALLYVCACVPLTVALCSAFSKKGDGAPSGELVYPLLEFLMTALTSDSILSSSVCTLGRELCPGESPLSLLILQGLGLLQSPDAHLQWAR